MERTAIEHRAAVEAWRETAPRNDSEIFGRRLKADKPRHRDLTELSALLAMRNRPIGVAEGVPGEPAPTVSSNWRTIPANDNRAPEEGFDREAAVEYVPSIDAIETAMAKVRMVYRAAPMMLAGGRHEVRRASREIEAIPVDGDVEFGTHIDDEGKAHRVTVGIGKLRFSDGTQTERGHRLIMDKVVEADIRMPVGAMLGCREKATREKGAETDVSSTNAHYRWMVPGRVATTPKLRPKKGERLAFSHEETKRMLADAYANTAVMPEIKRYPDGFPASPTNLRQLFIGGRKGKNGESGSQAWQDIYTEKENRDQFQRGLDAMADEHVRLLTEAMSAKSLGELGVARGFKGRHAIDAGRRLLVAANDNFEAAMELAKCAAEG
ncbi:hypothetical protein [Shinella sp. BYT-45]|uniref:hypothetical protein n=1 Tax=Shinella sp. BYT-45 TaxID=3377377 RepID=UPI00397EC768